MNRILLLNVEMPPESGQAPLHPAVLMDEEHCVLVDCGCAGFLPKIEEALRHRDVKPETVTHLVLTHQDHDHVGAAAALKRRYPNVRVLASQTEAPYISGAKKSLRLEQAERLQAALPPEQQPLGEAFCNLLRSVEPVPVDRTLADGEKLPFCGGCWVLATPGHTPGHISLYLPGLNTVITGDAMALESGRPVIANPRYTLDPKRAEESLRRLLALRAGRVLCYHGGELQPEDGPR